MNVYLLLLGIAKTVFIGFLKRLMPSLWRWNGLVRVQIWYSSYGMPDTHAMGFVTDKRLSATDPKIIFNISIFSFRLRTIWMFFLSNKNPEWYSKLKFSETKRFPLISFLENGFVAPNQHSFKRAFVFVSETWNSYLFWKLSQAESTLQYPV